MEIKTIIFDFDGTIADTFDKFCKIIQLLGNKHYNLHTSLEEIEFIMRHKGVRELISKLNLSKFQILKFTYLGRREFNKSMLKPAPFESIPPILQELKEQNYKLGIVSSNTTKYIEKFLKKYNIEVFDFIIKTSLFGKDKTLLKILKQQKLNINKTIYIGDEKRDIRACKSIGLAEIAVSYGYSSAMLLKEEKPSVIINSPKEIISTIKKINHKK